MKKRVLIITYDFPPVSGSGVQRPTKFAKYLSEYGWEPVVLTTQKGRVVARDPDATLEVQNVEVYRTASPYPYRLQMALKRWFERRSPSFPDFQNPKQLPRSKWHPKALMVPDAKVFWTPFALLWATKLSREKRCDVVLSTIPTPSAALLGFAISRLWGVPHVVDFRDPWFSAYYLPKRIKPLEQFERTLERKILQHASAAVVARKDELAEIARFVDEPGFPIELILNGYDEDDYEDVQPKRLGKAFVIAHVGVMDYPERGFKCLSEALRILSKARPESVEKLHIVQVGTVSPTLYCEIDELRTLVDVTVKPPVPHKEAICYMLGADLLYLPTFDNIIPGKTFEYLRVRKPILCVGDRADNVRSILEDTKSGQVFRKSDYDGIAQYITCVMAGLHEEPLPMSYIENYSRKCGVNRLAQLLNKVSMPGRT